MRPTRAGEVAGVVVNDLLTHKAHCGPRFTAASAREITWERYGKSGIWNAHRLFADRWSRTVLLGAGHRGNSSVAFGSALSKRRCVVRRTERAAIFFELGELTSEAHHCQTSSFLNIHNSERIEANETQ
jgi:hypothetical protein